ncbi:MAG: hypothetical protein ACOC3V_04570 [bacterium]
MPSNDIKVDIAYKKFLKRQYSSTNKKWHEEFPGKALTIKLKDIWIDELPSNPPTQNTSSIEIITDLELTQDVTVDGGLSWVTCLTPGDLTTQIGDFIQPDKELKQGYYIKLFDSVGSQIYVGDDSNWEFDYANGILTFESVPSGFIAPYSISGYRYIGRTGFDTGDFITTLDEAYDGKDGDGSGRIIHADFGPFQITPSNGSAALQLDPQTYTPVNGLADGQIINRGGILYIYDGTRNKWLSMMRQNITFGIKRADGCYLNVADFSSSNSGWPALRKGTILGMTAQASSGYANKKFIMSKNNDPTSIYNFSLNNYYLADNILDIDFETNDIIKILATSEFTTTYNVVINLEIAWRA